MLQLESERQSSKSCECELLGADLAATAGLPHSTTATGMEHQHWREFSRIVDVFRRVGRAGGKASLTTSTEGGQLKASLEIQMNLSTDAHSGQANATTLYSAAPCQDGAARRRRPRRRRGPAAAMRSRARLAAHQATLAAAAAGGDTSMSPPCQTIATRCQAAGKNTFPPPPTSPTNPSTPTTTGTH